MIPEPKSFCDPGKNQPTLIIPGSFQSKTCKENFNLSQFILLIPRGIKYKSKLFPAGFSFLEIQGGKQQITFSSGGWTHLREREFLGVSREFEKLSSGEEGTKDSRRGRNSTEIDIKSLPSVSTGGNHGQTKPRGKNIQYRGKKGNQLEAESGTEGGNGAKYKKGNECKRKRKEYG